MAEHKAEYNADGLPVVDLAGPIFPIMGKQTTMNGGYPLHFPVLFSLRATMARDFLSTLLGRHPDYQTVNALDLVALAFNLADNFLDAAVGGDMQACLPQLMERQRKER